jgi:ribulose-5-phosphate 4-epimerase/fuculose-1-phosphate aldolase
MEGIVKVLIVGGTFDRTGGRKSSIIKKLATIAKNSGYVDVCNGGTLKELQAINLEGYDLVFWWADVSNAERKSYPTKETGSVMIVSKVIRPNRTYIDAVARIFKLHGNAVVAIHKDRIPFEFVLIDALGNIWYRGTELEKLVQKIQEFYLWTKGSIRVRSCPVNIKQPQINKELLTRFIELNKEVANKYQKIKGRYFGNISTRCAKMFPTMREKKWILVSARNTDKERITADDMVLARLSDNRVEFIETRKGIKPSVDTPIQLKLYEKFPFVNYMIHGHAFVKGAPYTEHYYPCGDLREFPEVAKIIESEEKERGVINLRNHGFLLYASTLEEVEKLVNSLEFEKSEPIRHLD